MLALCWLCTGALFTAGHFFDDKTPQSGAGAVIFVFLGWFPFGREFCVLNLKDGLVQSKRTIFGADDHDYCDGDVRPVYECTGP